MSEKVTFEQMLPVIIEQLASGGEVRFKPNGTSMLPLIRQGIDLDPDICFFAFFGIGDLLPNHIHHFVLQAFRSDKQQIRILHRFSL